MAHLIFAVCVFGSGALACVDGVAFAPHGRVDVKALDIDFYLCSLYKIFGPHHALLYGKHEHLLAAKAQNHFFVGDEEIPLKLNVGGYDYEVVASLSGITAYFDALHEHHFPGANTGRPERLRQVYDLFAAHEEALSATMLEFLTSKTNLRVVGRMDPRHAVRAPTFSFVVEGRASSEIPELLASANLGADSGHFYAYRVVRDLGYLERGGVVRLSLVHYNSVEEVDRLIQRLDEVV